MCGTKLTGFFFRLSVHRQDRSAAAQEQHNDGITSVDAIGNRCRIGRCAVCYDALIRLDCVVDAPN